MTVESLEANYGIAGSFDANDISEYYLDPVALGYEHIIDFDHDFIGKDALRDKVENPDRTRVSFIWNDEDVIDIYASLFEPGESHKYLELPNPTVAGPVAHYDQIEKDGDPVGILKEFGYLYPERAMIGVGVIDVELAEPGTEVTIIHGQEQSPRPSVERHVNTEVRATVQPSPLHKNRG
ncbi:hypothetical protein [Halobellus rubicundus]|uniref:Aminomethyl transferase family protein n=1 Tax=Halobellus rubicundus TaxID=2996466 RepID=A0ABD5MJ69_9EURY